MFSLYILKRRLEGVFIYPFILIGRVIAFFRPLKKEYETYFFFSFYHTGGAEKVHSLIAKATGNENAIIIFTRKSSDDNFLQDFEDSKCEIRNISTYTDNKFLYFFNLIYRGIISAYVNKQKTVPVVFNGQCNFGYKISPWIKKKVPQIELIHSFNTFSKIRIPFIPFITKTVMISKVRIDDHLEQYKQLNVPVEYNNMISYIVNGIPLPGILYKKMDENILNVLYVGRGTEEKRIHLIARIAKEAKEKNLPAKFTFLGDVKNAIPHEYLPYCDVLGNKSDEEEIAAIYSNSHIVIITSSTEGFPMVVMEGMAYGCAIIATPVGDIPVHVKDNENGYLFSTIADEEKIVEEGIHYIEYLINDKNLLNEISNRNREYAFHNFGIRKFNQQYQELFNQLRNKV